MARVPLEELVMQIHLLGTGPAAAFLETVLQPPPPRSIQAAVSHLQTLKALTSDEQLTPLGIPLSDCTHSSLLGPPIAVLNSILCESQ